MFGKNLNKKVIKKTVQTCIWIFSFIPFVAAIIFALYVSFVKFKIGAWPVVGGAAAPESLAGLDQFTSLFVYLFLLSLTILPFTLLLVFFKSVRRTYLKALLVYLLGVVVVFLLSELTPLGSAARWYLD